MADRVGIDRRLRQARNKLKDDRAHRAAAAIRAFTDVHDALGDNPMQIDEHMTRDELRRVRREARLLRDRMMRFNREEYKRLDNNTAAADLLIKMGLEADLAPSPKDLQIISMMDVVWSSGTKVEQQEGLNFHINCDSGHNILTLIYKLNTPAKLERAHFTISEQAYNRLCPKGLTMDVNIRVKAILGELNQLFYATKCMPIKTVIAMIFREVFSDRFDNNKFRVPQLITTEEKIKRLRDAGKLSEGLEARMQILQQETDLQVQNDIDTLDGAENLVINNIYVYPERFMNFSVAILMVDYPNVIKLAQTVAQRNGLTVINDIGPKELFEQFRVMFDNMPVSKNLCGSVITCADDGLLLNTLNAAKQRNKEYITLDNNFLPIVQNLEQRLPTGVRIGATINYVAVGVGLINDNTAPVRVNNIAHISVLAQKLLVFDPVAIGQFISFVKLEMGGGTIQGDIDGSITNITIITMMKMALNALDTTISNSTTISLEEMCLLKTTIANLFNVKDECYVLNMSISTLGVYLNQLKRLIKEAPIGWTSEHATFIDIMLDKTLIPPTLARLVADMLVPVYTATALNPMSYIIADIKEQSERNAFSKPLQTACTMLIENLRSDLPTNVRNSVNRLKGVIGQQIAYHALRSMDIHMLITEDDLTEDHVLNTLNVDTDVREMFKLMNLSKPDGMLLYDINGEACFAVIEVSMITTTDSNHLMNKTLSKAKACGARMLNGEIGKIRDHYSKVFTDPEYRHQHFSLQDCNSNGNFICIELTPYKNHDDSVKIRRFMINIDIDSNEYKWSSELVHDVSMELSKFSHRLQSVVAMLTTPSFSDKSTAAKTRAANMKRKPVDLTLLDDDALHNDDLFENLSKISGPIDKETLRDYIEGEGQVRAIKEWVDEHGVDVCIEKLLNAILQVSNEDDVNTGESYDRQEWYKVLRTGLLKDKATTMEDKHHDELNLPFPLIKLSDKVLNGESEESDLPYWLMPMGVPSFHGLRQLSVLGKGHGKISKRSRQVISRLSNLLSLRINMSYISDSSFTMCKVNLTDIWLRFIHCMKKTISTMMLACHPINVGKAYVSIKKVRIVADATVGQFLGKNSEDRIRSNISIDDYDGGDDTTVLDDWDEGIDDDQLNLINEMIADEEMVVENEASEEMDVEDLIDVPTQVDVSNDELHIKSSIIKGYTWILMESLCCETHDRDTNVSRLVATYKELLELASMYMQPRLHSRWKARKDGSQKSQMMNEQDATAQSEIEQLVKKIKESAFKIKAMLNGCFDESTPKEWQVAVLRACAVDDSTIEKSAASSMSRLLICQYIKFLCNKSQLIERDRAERDIYEGLFETEFTTRFSGRAMVALRTANGGFDKTCKLKVRMLQEEDGGVELNDQIMESFTKWIVGRWQKHIEHLISMVERIRCKNDKLIDKLKQKGYSIETSKIAREQLAVIEASDLIEKYKNYQVVGSKTKMRYYKDLFLSICRGGKCTKLMSLIFGGTKCSETEMPTTSIASMKSFISSNELLAELFDEKYMRKVSDFLVDYFWSDDLIASTSYANGFKDVLSDNKDLIRDICEQCPLLMHAGIQAIIVDHIRASWPSESAGKYKRIRVPVLGITVYLVNKKLKDGQAWAAIMDLGTSEFVKNPMNNPVVEDSAINSYTRKFHIHPTLAAFMSQTFLHACMSIVDLDLPFQEDFGSERPDALVFMADFICKMRANNSANTSSMCGAFVFLDQCLVGKCLNPHSMLKKVDDRPRNPAACALKYVYYPQMIECAAQLDEVEPLDPELLLGFGTGGSRRLFISPYNGKRVSYLSQSWFENADAFYQKRGNNDTQGKYTASISEATVTNKQHAAELKLMLECMEDGRNYQCGLDKSIKTKEQVDENLINEVRNCLKTRSSMAFCSPTVAYLQGRLADRYVDKNTIGDIYNSKGLTDQLDSLSSTRSILVKLGKTMDFTSASQTAIINSLSEFVELYCSLSEKTMSGENGEELMFNDDDIDYVIDDCMDYLEMAAKTEPKTKVAMKSLAGIDFEGTDEEKRECLINFMKQQSATRSGIKGNKEAGKMKKEKIMANPLVDVCNGKGINVLSDAVKFNKAFKSKEDKVYIVSDNRVAKIMVEVSAYMNMLTGLEMNCTVGAESWGPYYCNTTVMHFIKSMCPDSIDISMDGGPLPQAVAEVFHQKFTCTLLYYDDYLESMSPFELYAKMSSLDGEKQETLLTLLVCMVCYHKKNTGMSDVAKARLNVDNDPCMFMAIMRWHTCLTYMEGAAKGNEPGVKDPDNILVKECSLKLQTNKLLDLINQTDELTATASYTQDIKSVLSMTELTLMISSPRTQSLFIGLESVLSRNPCASSSEMKFIEMAKFLVDMKAIGKETIFEIALWLISNHSEIVNRQSHKEQRGGPRTLDVNNVAGVLINRVVEMVSRIIAWHSEGELLAKPQEKYRVIADAEKSKLNYYKTAMKIAKQYNWEDQTIEHIFELIDHSKWGTLLSAIAQALNLSGMESSIPASLRRLVRLISIKQMGRLRLLPNSVRLGVTSPFTPLRCYEELHNDSSSKLIWWLSNIAVGKAVGKTSELNELIKQYNPNFAGLVDEKGGYRQNAGTGQGIWHDCSTCLASASTRLIDKLLEICVSKGYLTIQEENSGKYELVTQPLERWGKKDLIRRLTLVHALKFDMVPDDIKESVISVIPPFKMQTVRSSDDSEGNKSVAICAPMLDDNDRVTLSRAYIDCFKNIDRSARALTSQIQSEKSVFSTEFTQIYSHFSFMGSSPVAKDKSRAGACNTLQSQTVGTLYSEIMSNCIGMLKEGVDYEAVIMYHIYHHTDIRRALGVNKGVIQNNMESLPEELGGFIPLQMPVMVEGCLGVIDRDRWLNLCLDEKPISPYVRMVLSMCRPADNTFVADDVIKRATFPRRVPKLISQNEQLKTLRDDLRHLTNTQSESLMSECQSEGIRYLVEHSSIMDSRKTMMRIAGNYNIIQNRTMSSKTIKYGNASVFASNSPQLIVNQDIIESCLSRLKSRRLDHELVNVISKISSSRAINVMKAGARPPNARDEVDAETSDSELKFIDGRLVSHKDMLRLFDAMFRTKVPAPVDDENYTSMSKALYMGQYHGEENIVSEVELISMKLRQSLNAFRELQPDMYNDAESDGDDEEDDSDELEDELGSVSSNNSLDSSYMLGYWRHMIIKRTCTSLCSFKNRIEDVIIMQLGLDTKFGVMTGIKPEYMTTDISLLNNLLPELTTDDFKTEDDTKRIVGALSGLSGNTRNLTFEVHVFLPELNISCRQPDTYYKYNKRLGQICGSNGTFPSDSKTGNTMSVTRSVLNDILAYATSEYKMQNDSTWMQVPADDVLTRAVVGTISAENGTDPRNICRMSLLNLALYLSDRLGEVQFERFFKLISAGDGSVGKYPAGMRDMYLSQYDDYNIAKFCDCMIICGKDGRTTFIVSHDSLNYCEFNKRVVSLITSIRPGTAQEPFRKIRLTADNTSNFFDSESGTIEAPVDLTSNHVGWLSIDDDLKAKFYKTGQPCGGTKIAVYQALRDDYNTYIESVNKHTSDTTIINCNIDLRTWTYCEISEAAPLVSVEEEIKIIIDNMSEEERKRPYIKGILNSMRVKMRGGELWKLPSMMDKQMFFAISEKVNSLKGGVGGVLVEELIVRAFTNAESSDGNVSESDDSSVSMLSDDTDGNSGLNDFVKMVTELGLGVYLPDWVMSNKERSKYEITDAMAFIMCTDNSSGFAMKNACEGSFVDTRWGCSVPWKDRNLVSTEVTIRSGGVMDLFYVVVDATLNQAKQNSVFIKKMAEARFNARKQGGEDQTNEGATLKESIFDMEDQVELMEGMKLDAKQKKILDGSAISEILKQLGSKMDADDSNYKDEDVDEWDDEEEYDDDWDVVDDEQTVAYIGHGSIECIDPVNSIDVGFAPVGLSSKYKSNMKDFINLKWADTQSVDYVTIELITFQPHRGHGNYWNQLYGYLQMNIDQHNINMNVQATDILCNNLKLNKLKVELMATDSELAREQAKCKAAKQLYRAMVKNNENDKAAKLKMESVVVLKHLKDTITHLKNLVREEEIESELKALEFKSRTVNSVDDLKCKLKQVSGMDSIKSDQIQLFWSLFRNNQRVCSKPIGPVNEVLEDMNDMSVRSFCSKYCDKNALMMLCFCGAKIAHDKLV